MSMRWSKLEVTSTAAVAALAVAVRLPGTGSRPLWADEVASARVVTEPTLLSMLGRVVHTESTPPFWYFGVWLLHRAGLSPQDGRLVSVALGGVLAALVVVLARRFVSFPLALTAGALTALGGELVDRGRELRAYELLAVLSVLFALCLLDEISAPTRGRALALGAVVAAGGLTHFFFAFTVLAATAWVLLEPELAPVRARVLRAIAAGGAVALAWLPFMLMQYHAGRFWWIGAFRLRTVVAIPLRLFTDALSRPHVGPALSTLMVLLVAAGGARLARGSPAGRLVLLLALGPIVQAAAVWALGMPIFDLRNLIGVGAFVALAAAAALDALPQRVAAVGGAALVVAIGLPLAGAGLGFRPPYDRMAAALVRSGWDESQPIAVFGDPFRFRLPLGWYLPGRPTLAIVRRDAHTCGDVFLVRASGAVTRHRPRLPVTSDPALRGAVFLVAHPQHPCVTPRSDLIATRG